MKRKFTKALSLALILMMILTTGVLASSVDVAVVDVTDPTGSVTLNQGQSGPITINMSVTGKQEGTATFKVNTVWSLSGGAFIGSNPETFTVYPRVPGDAATTFSITGTVTVASDQAVDTFILAVGAIDITNDNTTGAKLAALGSSSYSIKVEANTAPSVVVTGVTDGDSYVKGSVPVAGCSVTDVEDEPSPFAATLINGPDFADGIGSQTASCSYTDGGGLTATASATYSIIDNTPPPANTAPSVVVTGVTDGDSYVKGSVPVAGCSVTDAEDGSSAFAATLINGPDFADGIGSQTASCSYTDGGGLTANASATYSIIDNAETTPQLGFVLWLPLLRR